MKYNFLAAANLMFLLSAATSCTNSPETADSEKHSTLISTSNKTDEQDMSNSIYNYSFKTLEGKEINFSDFRGKKILIVNTASECGYTPQYEQLEQIHQKYNNKLVVLGFPTNDFGGQEPGSNEEIGEFCQKNYGVTFPIAEKITVKGENTPELYKWLTSKSLNKKMDSEVKWNFQKYLIDEEGALINVYGSKVTPDAPEIIKEIEG